VTAVIFLYSTAPDATTAEAIGHALVESGAAACVNIIPGMTSIYRWEGRVETAAECVPIVKTTADRAARIVALILERHPYRTPAIAALPINEELSSGPFVEWIRNSR
jgi:periplasmic divalent cation tolerance protein